jgi:hypothetical protein
VVDSELPKRLTPEQCREKARECRDIAQRVANPEHRAMLLLMADTWDQMATAGKPKAES